MPFAVEFTGFQEGEFPVEKHVEAVNAGMEKFGKSQVSEFVSHDQ